MCIRDSRDPAFYIVNHNFFNLYPVLFCLLPFFLPDVSTCIIPPHYAASFCRYRSSAETAYKTICWFSASPIGKMFPQPLHRTSSFPLLNICSDVSSHFHIFSFPQNAFITAFRFAVIFRFFRKTKDFRYSRLRSVSPHSAVFSCFPKRCV